MAHIFITGGTGFVGEALIPALLQAGHRLTVLSRNPAKAQKHLNIVSEALSVVSSLDSLTEMPDGVINLAGLGIADARWSDRRKRDLRASRIGVTEALAERLKALSGAPDWVISGSAVGYYGPHKEGRLSEDSPPGWDFAARLCSDWEAAAAGLEGPGTRSYRLRIGVVMGRPGGFLGRLEMPFKLGLGGPLGHGQQMLSWIHREDLVRMMLWCIEAAPPAGAYNAVAPNPVSNAEFTQALAQAVRRPAWFRVPEAPMRMVLGELAGLLFEGQAVVPTRALAEGFEFKHPHLAETLKGLFR